MTRRIRVALYSHDSIGLGHMRRNLFIARRLASDLPALTGTDVSGLLITGVMPALCPTPPTGFDWVSLPGIAKGADGYEPRTLNEPMGDLITVRSALADAVLDAFAPDLLIIDRHVFGVAAELREPLRRLRESRPATRIVLGLREVLDAPDVAAAEWERIGDADLLRALVDEVWVYGDPEVHDPVSTGEAPPALVDRIRFTGYLATGRSDADPVDALHPLPYVLTTAGGGSDGAALLRAAASMRVPTGHRHLLVTGPQLDAVEFAAIERRAEPMTKVVRTCSGMAVHIARAGAVLAMGGYNTACEILANPTPALIVPREHPRTEQLIRARALQNAGVVDVARASRITPAFLSAWAERNVRARVDRSGIARDGLGAVARFAARLLTDPRPARPQEER